MNSPVPADKRQRILDAALRLFTEQGFHGTSTAAIAKHAAVATGTLFHYFPSKQQLINHLYLQIKAELAEGLPVWPNTPTMSVEQLRAAAHRIWRHSLCWCIQRPLQLRFFAQYRHSPYIHSQIQQQAEQQLLAVIPQLLNAGLQLGVFKPLPPALLYQMAQGLLLHSAFYYIDQQRMPTESEADQLVAVLWHALCRSRSADG